MDRPWIAENAVPESQARSLIESQFSDLAPARLVSLGVGWDNTAWLVNDRWVFRFPRREIAVDLIEAECRLLPTIAERLPLPVPVPEMIGHADDGYPWPFAGYRMIAGETACRARLDDRTRTSAAQPIAEFLAALHAVPTDEARRAGAGPDALGRLDVGRRTSQIEERLAQCDRLGLAEDVGALEAVIDAVPEDWTAGGSTLVHGDLYARHLLVDAGGRPVGVIDWGDVHLGDPAVDLSIAHGFLSPSAHGVFRDAYGPIDEATWHMARFKALHSAVMILAYGHDVGDEDLLFEGRAALRHISESATAPE